MEQHRCIQSTLEAGVVGSVASHSRLTPQRSRLTPQRLRLTRLISSTFYFSKPLSTQSGPSRMNRHHARLAQWSCHEKDRSTEDNERMSQNEMMERMTPWPEALVRNRGVFAVLFSHVAGPLERRGRVLLISFPFCSRFVPVLFPCCSRSISVLFVRVSEGALNAKLRRYITCKFHIQIKTVGWREMRLSESNSAFRESATFG